MKKQNEEIKITGLLASVFVFLSFLLGIGAGFLLFSSSSSSSFSLFHDEREQGHGYVFVSPLLACGEEPFDHIGNDQMKRLEDELHTYIQSEKKSERISVAGVYFRQLKGGPWLGVDFEREFVPGSLLKVPLAMAVWKEIEKNREFAATEIFFEEGGVLENQYFTNLSVTPGRSYTIETLIENMLVRSDNNAAALLAKAIGATQLQDAYVRLGIEIPEFGQDYSVSVRDYASFFRVLYNATYLSNESSEKVLETLSRSNFKDGLVAGVPSGTKVAHKFGERSVGRGSTVQLHDCGIIYHPERPYLLCVMTQGTNFDVLAAVIGEISKLVYEHVD